MCYRMGLSTDCPQNLAVYNSDTLFFQRQAKKNGNLHYPQVYRLATMTADGCGCFFRILAAELADDPGFCPLQEWLEDPDEMAQELANTWRLWQVIVDLRGQGFAVDGYLAWEDLFDQPAEQSKTVSLATLTPSHFALFEHVRFEFE